MPNGNLTVNNIYSVTDRSVCLLPMSNEINILLLCVSMHMGVCVCGQTAERELHRLVMIHEKKRQRESC